jgi:hypothetical protein
MRQSPKAMAPAGCGPGNSFKNFALNPECSGEGELEEPRPAQQDLFS